MMQKKMQLERIRYYEDIMREAERLLGMTAAPEDTLEQSGGQPENVLEQAAAPEDALAALQEKISELYAYYGSTEWRQDFADDEAGLLPSDLPRGVLSEDGIYNLLMQYKEFTENYPKSKESGKDSLHNKNFMETVRNREPEGMDLKAKIDGIKLIDAHVHCVDPYYWMKYVGSFPFGFRLEKPDPTTMRKKRDGYLKGYQELYDFPYDELTPETEKELDAIWRQTVDCEAEFDMKAFDKAGVEMGIEMCLSGPELPPGLPQERFKMAVLIDGFLLPLDNADIGNNERQKQFVKMGCCYPQRMLQKYQPQTFEEYLDMISRCFDSLAEAGVVALKMNYPYWRSVQVEVVEKEEAEKVYEEKNTDPVLYRKLQDYIMRFMIAKAAGLDLPVQIHTGGIGITQPLGNTNPVLLEDLLWLPECKAAKIVFLHAAYPYHKLAGFMASRTVNAPDIYIDFSMIIHSLPGAPDAAAEILKGFLLEGLENKLMYGSDGNNPMTTWLGAYNGRAAVYKAVRDLVEEGYLDEAHAFVVAKKLLRDNAATLYKL